MRKKIKFSKKGMYLQSALFFRRKDLVEDVRAKEQAKQATLGKLLESESMNGDGDEKT